VLQATSDFGLKQESRAAVLVMSEFALNFFQRHLTMELGVHRDVDLAQTPFGVRAKDAEAALRMLAGRGDLDRGGRMVSHGRSVLTLRIVAPHKRQGGFYLSIAEFAKLFSNRSNAAQRRQAPARITVVVFKMPGHKRREQLAIFLSEALFDEDLFESSRFVTTPSAHSLQQLIPANEVHLQGEESEEQILIVIVIVCHYLLATCKKVVLAEVLCEHPIAG
jgi:hypothetical protein